VSPEVRRRVPVGTTPDDMDDDERSLVVGFEVDNIVLVDDVPGGTPPPVVEPRPPPRPVGAPVVRAPRRPPRLAPRPCPWFGACTSRHDCCWAPLPRPPREDASDPWPPSADP